MYGPGGRLHTPANTLTCAGRGSRQKDPSRVADGRTGSSLAGAGGRTGSSLAGSRRSHGELARPSLAVARGARSPVGGGRAGGYIIELALGPARAGGRRRPVPRPLTHR